MVTDINENITHYKFSECATENPPIIKGTIENFLKEKLENSFSFGYWNLRQNGIFKLSGWVFDFRSYLKHYVFKSSWGIEEGYFLNKTNLRKSVRGRIIYIKEIQ